MLKYEIKLTDDSFKQEELVWSEKYLAPDLSFVSGVTSQDYHLEKFKKLSVTNRIVNNNNALATLETENVIRQGYVIIKDKVYEVNSGSVVDYSENSEGVVTNYDYLFLNGKYYYSYNGSKFKIDHWLTEKLEMVEENVMTVEIVEDTVEVASETVDWKKIVKLDTIVWIEDGLVTIDGHEYFFDKDEQVDGGNNGCLKYFENGDCLDAENVTLCSDIEFHHFESVSDYIEATKFKLTKDEEISEDFERISFCKYFYYIRHKEHYLPIYLDGTTFKCDIPNYLIGNENLSESDYYKTVTYTVSGKNEESGAVYELTGDTFDVLFKNTTFVKIEDKEFNVENDIMNANDGKIVAVYLVGDTSNIEIGDRIRFVNGSESGHTQYVRFISEASYNFNQSDTDFVLFNGKKYKLEKNLCDKVLINGNEYPIIYNNGKVDKKDCLVQIGDEQVPMYISGVTTGANQAGMLTRYGRIISGTSQSAITAGYDIIPHSGITVDNKRYIVVKEDEDNYYVYLDRNNEYTFLVEDIHGSSMVVCTPDINKTDFTDEFTDFITREICQDVVDNQMYMILYTKNKIFGDKEIIQELAFQDTINPTSSDDYFNLFENLNVFTKNGYIHIPLALSNSQGNNIMQDDIVENRFFEEVKNNAINPIVDMEKDVYYPKYILNSNESIKAYKDSLLEGSEKPSDDELRTAYIGSYTDFHPIKQIRVNPHFRTRDLDSWKVNEGYNNVASSGDTDNWFITDMNPYRRIIGGTAHLYEIVNGTARKIDDHNRELDILYNTPDLVGLLYFTNDDVYYQKTKLAKSFLRFTYYDNTDPQTQSLLATSTVFMDEHKLFKRFIDNSRKNVNDYGVVTGVTYEIGQHGEYTMENGKPKDISSGNTIHKVSVISEYLGSRKDTRNHYLRPNNRYQHFDGVIIDDEHRIGSELIIDNKINTDTSSEGYYLYIFREYSENLHPKPIYMKVEFSHAGIGHTIPFLIPMRWSDEVDSDGNRAPISALTLSSEDLPLLRQGIRLEDVYAQTYIPLYAVYDFKNKEYAYVYDSRYVTISDENVAVLNLFELKIQNEEIPVGSDEEEQAQIDEQVKQIQRNITIKQQATARIDVNKKQFKET